MLPTEKTVPIEEFDRLKILLYGEHRVGKSTFCAQIPNAIFLSTQAGLTALSVYSVNIDSWESLIVAVKELSTSEHKFTTIIIDTIDDIVDICTQYICRKYSYKNIAITEWGSGYRYLYEYMGALIKKLCSLPYGVIFISQQKKDTMTIAPGETIENMVPAIPDKIYTYIARDVNIILYSRIEIIKKNNEVIKQHVLKTNLSPYYRAGHRLPVQLDDTIPIDYDTFMSYFTEKRN